METTERIIIVDDDIDISKSLSFLLKKEGYKTETAITGRETIKKVQEKYFNIALLDINLPDIDGIELLALLKETYADIEVIMITGNDDIEYAIKALNEGASAYILKPLNIDNLLAKIKQSIEKQKLISDKRRADEKIREQSNLLNAIFNTTPNPFVLKDEKSIYLAVNKAFCEFIGKKEEEIIGKTDYDLFPAEEAEKYIIGDRAVMSGGQQQKEEWQVMGAGGLTWLQVIKTPVLDETRESTGVLCSITDISKIKEADQKLRESEKNYRNLSKLLDQKVKERTNKLKISKVKYQNIINNISDVLLEVNVDGIITYISPQIQTILGYQPEEFILLNLKKFIHPDSLSSYKEVEKKSLKYKESFYVECNMQHKNGYYVPMSLKGSFVEINEVLKFFGILSDNTERKKIDNMIKREIKKLKELDQIRSNLIRRISHELKTPLTSIFSGTQYLINYCNGKVSENIQTIAKNVYRGGNRLKDLVDNLIIAYDLESEELKLNLKKENLIPIIKNCIENVVFQAKKRNVFINVELLEELYLDVDKSKISIVISNIISNAVKNTPPKGNIFIKTFEHHDYIDIIIKDTGVGLIKKELPILFEKFGKIERYGKGMDVDIEGPGLGLYISKEIVKLHKGEIFVASKGRNKGSKFTIRLYTN